MYQGPFTIVEVGFLKECNDLEQSSSKSMSSVLGYKRDAIWIKVIKYEGTQPSDCRKFSVDPQITSYEVLYSLLAKAFDVQREFSVCYRVLDDNGQETFLPLLSDYELDAAIQDASDPCLCLRIDFVDSFSSDVAECVQPESSLSLMSLSFTQTKVPLKLQGLLKTQVERTVNMFKGALSYMEEQSAAYLPPRAPLTDAEFRQFLDPVGQIIQSRELRTVIYYGGIEPSLRRVVWKHILNVYPEGMSGKERMEYTKRKSDEYYHLRDTWKDLLKKGQMVGDLAYVTGMVRKDVLRTDRHHVFYAGADDNCNVISLFNILTTYALNHPAVSYCQGMSDLASPLLVTMSNEAHAYICFCALMRRLTPSFLIDGIRMTQRFQHLADGLEFYHPKFYEYLKSHQADDLLYCYRWLLLEMKREFAFNDALMMLEVMWSSLPPSPPQGELPLYEIKFEPPPSPALSETAAVSPSPSPRENQYTKVCAIRRQTTSATSSPFKLNATTDESLLAQRRKQNKTFSSTDTKIISTNGILKSHSSQSGFLKTLTSQAINQGQPEQSMVQKLTQLTKDNIHRSLEKINTQGSEYLTRKGSLKLQNSSTKIVRNLNEFLNFGKKPRSIEQEYRFDKQISLDETRRRKSDVERRCSMVNREKSEPISEKDDFRINEEPGHNYHTLPLRTPNTLKREIQHVEDSLAKKIEAIPQSLHLSQMSPDSEDDSSEYYPMTSSITQELKLELENLNRDVLEASTQQEVVEDESGFESTSSSTHNGQFKASEENQIFIWENPLDENRTLAQSQSANSLNSNNSNKSFESDSSTTSGADSIHSSASEGHVREVAHVINSRQSRQGLPPPNEFGGGNPFLMFLCVSVLCQHSEHIMSHQMDYNEMAIYFDKMIRKHNVHRVLNEARRRYESYLCNYRQMNRQVNHHSPRV